MALHGCSLPLDQRDVLVIEIHQHRDADADGQVHAHSDGDGLDAVLDLQLVDALVGERGALVAFHFERLGHDGDREDAELLRHLRDDRRGNVAMIFAFSLPVIVMLTLGGIGGCPYAPGASGNISSEDAIHMLHAVGHDTGIDLGRLLTVARWLPKVVGHEVPGQVAKAGRTQDLHPEPAYVAELRSQFA